MGGGRQFRLPNPSSQNWHNMYWYWSYTIYCHNPGQPKTKSPGVVLISVRKTTPHHTTPGMITIQAVLGNPGSCFLVCSLILTQLEEIWKTTSIFLKMEDDLNFVLKKEDDLNFFENGRRPQNKNANKNN